MDTIERILEELENIGVSPAKMMRELGFSSGLFSQWKSGKQKPSAEKLSKIAEYLHTTTDYLLGNSDVKHSQIELEPFPEAFTPVPVIGQVAAGYIALAETDIEGYELVSTETLNDGYDYAYLRVKGDSMEPLIMDGDLVLVRIQEEVSNRDYAVVIVDEENGVVKKVLFESNKVTLLSENPDYPPREFVGKDMQRIRFFGKAIEIKRKL